MATYTLMIKNRRIGKLEIIKDTVNRINLSGWVSSIYKNPEEFIINRINVVNRKNILDMCKFNSLYTLQDYVDITKCISVTDGLWLDNDLKPTTWDKINAYNNRISNLLADSAINGIQYLHGKQIKSPSPQYKIAGSTDKCVKRVSGKDGLFLYKSLGTIEVETTFVRPYSEYFAYQIANRLGIKNIVKYDIKEHIAENGFIKPYCICKLFTDENISLVDYADSIYSNMSLLEMAEIFYKNNMLNDVRTILDMCILDSIILNNDRHPYNYGFLLNNNTGKFIGFTPIYDNDCSLGALDAVRGYSVEDVYKKVINRQPKTELGDYNEQALRCMYPDMFRRLQAIKNIELHKNKINGISNKRIELMNYIVNKRINEIVSYIKEIKHIS